MTSDSVPDPPSLSVRQRAYIVIFQHDTRAGKAFDVTLLIVVVASVIAVVLESVGSIRADHGQLLRIAEWAFTAIFTVEYVVRVWAAHERIRYVSSFYGVVDLLAIVPTYLSALVPGAQGFLVVRILRLLRMFRILKLGSYYGEADHLLVALKASLPKITVFLGAVLSLVVIIGASMHLIEGPARGFVDIPSSMYWAIVTLTTVGYGDITPATTLGRMFASVVMIAGYGIIAVPTGIVSAEMVRTRPVVAPPSPACPACGLGDHPLDARYCRRCGVALPTVKA
ncbi:MAG TPA: ion transporter [Kofleriaceae bacterium]|nr:ion transporter [Kofleriaceae bacterium]